MDTSIEEMLKKIDSRLTELENEERQKKAVENYSYDEELENLIGLSEVKLEVTKLVNYLTFLQKIKGKANIDKINLNMVFKGNAGTGKTTVARIMANILYELGYLSNNMIIETTPKDFIAGYVGQTALKTRKLLDKYKGGLIFIDEAYSFVSTDDHSFTNDAITEIIKEMETKETVFIFAGYDKEMEDFIDLNPGIKSRIGYNIEFADYSEEELLEIFLSKLNKSGLSIDDMGLEKVKEIIQNKKKEKNFGNGRMVDNLYNKIVLEHANTNYEEEDMSKLLMITSETINNINFESKRGGYFG